MALAAMLQIGKTLEAEQFAKKVVPALSKLFTSTDRAIRRSLLENIDVYGRHLDEVGGTVPVTVCNGVPPSPVVFVGRQNPVTFTS